MASRHPGPITAVMENIVSNPLRATIAVGLSISIFQLLVKAGADFWAPLIYILYLVPFVPPFVVTRTAKRINERVTEHAFVADAEPLVFVAYPSEVTPESLLATKPDVVSDSAARHLNRPIQEILDNPMLNNQYVGESQEFRKVAEHLASEIRQNPEKAVLRDHMICLHPPGTPEPLSYLMYSVLKKAGGKFKWQGTLARHDCGAAS